MPKKIQTRLRTGYLGLLAAALLPLGCAVQQDAPVASPPVAATTLSAVASLEMPPPAPREFRAAWVASVANIDWPSKPDLPVAQQKAEIIAILDKLQALNMNAVVLQVRPSADAIYPSKLEPWTEYLTGTMGKAPEPYYDPLAMWVEQAHARGIELHAWINPYRARQAGAKSAPSNDHIIKANPNSVREYGKVVWMDPGDAFASQRTLDVVTDLVRRYDIDGMHLDDYFYPYPVEAPKDSKAASDAVAAALDGQKPAVVELDFPDEPTWQAYVAGGGKLSRHDWRRQNVNTLIEKMYRTVHKEKSWVRFGISPFGIPKPNLRPEGICCFSQYDKLYADAELWFNNGWLDYFTPQLYWPIDQKPQAFGTLLQYWPTQNKQGRHFWPGIYTSRLNDDPVKTWKPEELVNQIALSREHSGGHIHFSMAALMQNRHGISDKLKA
ncbi:MAG TPA: family 10 glycosylhydrolase, partial [Burkholderiaceae bacterium]